MQPSFVRSKTGNITTQKTEHQQQQVLLQTAQELLLSSSFYGMFSL